MATSFADLRSAGTALGVPLRDRRLVLEPPRPRRRVAAQLPRDRRRAPTQAAARSPAHRASALAAARCPRARRTTGSGPTPSAEDMGSRRQRDGTTGTPTGDDTPASTAASSVFSPTSDRRPEPDPVLAPRHRRPARRRDLPPIQLHLPLPLPHRRHRTPPRSRCCDDQLNPPCDAAVGVVDEPGRRPPAGDGHLERVDDEVGLEVVAHRPADDLAASTRPSRRRGTGSPRASARR